MSLYYSTSPQKKRKGGSGLTVSPKTFIPATGYATVEYRFESPTFPKFLQ